MAEKFICMQCDKDEVHCACEKYCVLCMGSHDVRLWQDGAYYCQACREACGYVAQYQ